MSEKDYDSDSSSGDEEPTTAQDIVVTKYNMGAEIVNAVLKELVGRCTDGASIGELIDAGDKLLSDRAAKLFRKDKKMKKGIAFPTCISVNNCICHFSPLKSEGDKALKDGDVVKVDLGVHLDGFIATAAHTVVVGASKENRIKGPVADALLAGHNALEAAIRMLRPDAGHKNTDVTDVITKVADAYHVKPVENMLSHQLTRHKIDGEKQIIQAPGEKERGTLEKCEFEDHDVFAIDILISTGEGKAREGEARTTVYKKADDLIYNLKMKISRAFLTEVRLPLPHIVAKEMCEQADKKFGVHPFSLRHFDDEAKAKMGVGECERHGLMKPYQVLWEREGAVVVQFKSTVLVMPNGLLKITGLPFEAELYESEHKIEDPKLATLIASSLKPKKKPAAKTAEAPKVVKKEKKDDKKPAAAKKVTPKKDTAKPKA